jgi:uncharacterized protein (TIGR02466 family)
MAEFVKPFGPFIMVDSVSDEFVGRLNAIADRVLANETLGARLDWSHKLAGNVHKEFLVGFPSEAERDWAFSELKPKALQYYERLVAEDSAPAARPIGPDGVRFEGMWVVSQRSGDFNPTHKHGGDFSGVVYLRLPEQMEAEWQAEDHYPTAGVIEFIDGRPNRFARTGYRLRPRPGMLLLFPAWLLHTVYPFRCEGERRSMSFNIVLPELADC